MFATEAIYENAEVHLQPYLSFYCSIFSISHYKYAKTYRESIAVNWLAKYSAKQLNQSFSMWGLTLPKCSMLAKNYRSNSLTNLGTGFLRFHFVVKFHPVHYGLIKAHEI